MGCEKATRRIGTASSDGSANSRRPDGPASTGRRDFGGRGLKILQTIIYHEELQRVNAPIPFIGSGPSLVGPTLMQWGTAEQKDRFIPQDRQRRRNLVPGLFRAQFGLRPRLAADASSRRRRRLPNQWPEDLDLAGAICGLGIRAVPHRSRSSQASRHQLHPGGYEDPGITVRPLVQMTGATRFQRGLFRRRARARRKIWSAKKTRDGKSRSRR